MKLTATPSFRLDGRRALVTGAGRGIGLAAASALADAGAHVTLASRTTTEIEDAVRGTRLDLAQVGLAGVEDKEGLLGRLAQALGFPEWFGGNWDALEDCLCDLSWRRGDGHVAIACARAGGNRRQGRAHARKHRKHVALRAARRRGGRT